MKMQVKKLVVANITSKVYKGEAPLCLSFVIGTRKGNVEVDFVMRFIGNQCGGIVVATYGNTICVEEVYKEFNDVYEVETVIDLISNKTLSPAELFQFLRSEIPGTSKAINCALKGERDANH